MGSLYRQSIPPMIKGLRNLSDILEKGQKFADEKNMKYEYMMNFRLIHDMQGLPYQVQSCCNTAKFLPSRLGAIEDKYFEDNETTFEEFHERINKTIELLQNIDQSGFEGLESKPVIMKTARMGSFKFESGQSYVADYAMPNFWFHLSSAYCILRYLGVPVNAMDYLGRETFVKAE